MIPRRELRVTRRAEREIRTAATWWRENRGAAPDAVREELERVFELLGVRRIHLSRIRYDLYYRVAEDHIDLLALWHSSRGSRPSL